ncbi:helix-turn-helix domain-containing protein [Salinarimonas sp.]|uniref:helix-turn-helix domain-containing protein n=1 Tax=Salinarimonas sp. TaxID=2766526 RepID=UPI0032D97FCF
MATVRKSLAAAEPFRFTPEERARLEGMTEAEIEHAAADDPDNPPLSDDQIARMRAARVAREARERTGLTQAEFAERFQISLGRVRDLEQGRFRPDPALIAYLTVIREEPDVVRRALDAA